MNTPSCPKNQGQLRDMPLKFIATIGDKEAAAATMASFARALRHLIRLFAGVGDRS